MSTRLAALGDSTSCGEGVGLRVPARLTWPARLAAAASAELLALAVPGARLRDVRAGQLPRAVASGADVLTLLVGLNDVSRGGFDADRFTVDLLATVAELRGTGALVLVGRLPEPPLLRPLPAGLRTVVRSRTAAVNAAVDACAGGRVLVMDLPALAGLRQQWAWDVDRVHPNAAGHGLIAQAAAVVLRESGCRVADVAPMPPPPTPGRQQEARWLLRHGMPWLTRHLPQVVLPATAAVARSGRLCR